MNTKFYMKKNNRCDKYTIEHGSAAISCNIIHASRKGMRIVVSPGPCVNVYAPKNSSESYIRSILTKKTSWIAKSIDKLENCRLLTSPEAFEGGSITYLGSEYQLKIDRDNTCPPQLNGKNLCIGAGKNTSSENIMKKVDSWYRKQARQIFEKFMEDCFAEVSEYGIPRPFLNIRKMRSRWGSCRSSGRITLNLHLVQLPEQCIEYVIMHELCHLKHLNHSADFYAFLTSCLPDWKKRKGLLDNIRLP